MISGTVRQHPYRSAMIGEIFLVLPREDMKKLEEQLAESAGARMDNHTVYEIQQTWGTTYLMFSDFKVVFGRSIEVRSY